MVLIFLSLLLFPDSKGKRVTFDLDLWEESYKKVDISLEFQGDFWANRTYSIRFETQERKIPQEKSNDVEENSNKYTEFRSPDGRRTGIRMICSSGSVCWFISFQGGLLHQISKFHRGGVSVHDNQEPWQIIQFDSKARIAFIQNKILNVVTKKLYLYEGEVIKEMNFLVENRVITREKFSHQGKHQVRREISQRNYITGDFESKGSIVTKKTQDGNQISLYYDFQGNLLQTQTTDKQGDKTTEAQDSLGQESFYENSPFRNTRQQQLEITEQIESITSRTALLLQEESWDFEPFSDCNLQDCLISGGQKIRYYSPSYEHWITTWSGNEREKTALYTPEFVEKIYETHKQILTYNEDKSTTFKRFFYPYNIPYGETKTTWSKNGFPLEKIQEKSRTLYFYEKMDSAANPSEEHLERIFVLDRVEIYESLQKFLQEKPYPEEKILPFLKHLKNFLQVNHKKRISLDENGRVIKYSRWTKENILQTKRSGICLSLKFYAGAPNLNYRKARSLLDFVEDGILLTKVDVSGAQTLPTPSGGWNEFFTQEEDMVDPELENLSTKIFLWINKNVLEEITITRYTTDGLIYAEQKVTRKKGLEPRKIFSNGFLLHERETKEKNKFFTTFEDVQKARVQSPGS